MKYIIDFLFEIHHKSIKLYITKAFPVLSIRRFNNDISYIEDNIVKNINT